MLNIEKNIQLRDKDGFLTVRGIAWMLYTKGYWTIWEYNEFCSKNNFLPF